MSKIPPFRIPLPSEHLCPGIMKSYRAAREEWVNSDSACTDWPLGLCGLRDQTDEENRYCKLPTSHDGDHFYVDRGSYDATGTGVATGSGECHAPPANIYDVLSRLFEAAKREVLPWRDVIDMVHDHIAIPFVGLGHKNRFVDVMLEKNTVYCARHFFRRVNDQVEFEREFLITPADYARAYRWLVTGEQG